MWEYGDLYFTDNRFYFNGYELRDDGYGVNDLIKSLNILGGNGWELVLKYNEKYLLKRNV